MGDKTTTRLNRYIASSGICSRRAADKLIEEGQVSINGEVITELGIQVLPDDEVRVNGDLIKPVTKETFLFYKPHAVVTTMSDQFGRRSVADFLPPNSKGVKPAGRLDYDTDGLLIMTSDGDIAARLTHPRYKVDKEYETTIRGIPESRQIKRLEKGMVIDGVKTSPAKVLILKQSEKKGETRIRITIHEGRNRQVRKMFDAIGHKVLKLRRTRIGFLTLTGLEPGQMRRLSANELKSLHKLLGLPH